MAESTEQGDAGTAQAPKSNTMMMVAVVAGSIVAGSVIGGAVVAPRFVGGGGGGGSHDEATEEPSELVRGPLVEIENLVVNPAGSAGSRFLMVSVAFEVPDSEAEERLHGGALQLRDAVASSLERLSIDKLSQPGARDSLKSQLLELARPLAGDPEWMRVYLPQFVVQ